MAESISENTPAAMRKKIRGVIFNLRADHSSALPCELPLTLPCWSASAPFLINLNHLMLQQHR